MNKKITLLTLAIGASFGLTACDKPVARKPASNFYASLASASAEVDAETARNMISAYRRNKGLGPLLIDPSLMAAARQEAKAMAGSDTPSSAETIKQRLAQNGIQKAEVNTSAGYHTLPEAFSGWRDSPQHNKVMLAENGKRLGIATAYAPGSKYKVYWVLIVSP